MSRRMGEEAPTLEIEYQSMAELIAEWRAKLALAEGTNETPLVDEEEEEE